MIALKKAVLAFSSMEVLHRIVVPDPIQDVSNNMVQEDTTPQELLQMQLKQGITSTMHSMELSLDVCPGILCCVGVHK